MSAPPRVVVTGTGWVTPLGHSIDAVWKRLMASESGMAPITHFDASTFPTTFAAEVRGFDVRTLLKRPEALSSSRSRDEATTRRPEKARRQRAAIIARCRAAANGHDFSRHPRS